tara:strand:- start:2857 stop:3468 length:612 start_codon:yes stop_codon:yes gene_type:complete
MNDLKDFFKNKTVAIVGNAMNIYNKNYGDLIDDHDIVVRMNHAPMQKPINEGKKTTIIAFCGGGTGARGETHNFNDLAKKFKNADIKILALNESGLLKIRASNRLLNNCFFAGDSIKTYCRSQTDGKKPSSGWLMMHYINICDKPKSVSVFGYDWKKTRSNWHPEVTERDRDGNILSSHTHHWQKEEILCKSIIKENNWKLYE